MKIRKILLAPIYAVLENNPSGSGRRTPAERARSWVRGVLGRPRLLPYHAELLYCADLPRILGSDNVFTLGRVWPHMHSSKVPEYCPFPSLHSTPRATAITPDELDEVLPQVDAVIVSPVAWDKHDPSMRDRVIRRARELSVPVALFDTLDHEQIYGSADYGTAIFHGLEQGRHFDVYFKKDLLLGFASDVVFPICPAPVRPESYEFSLLPKDIDVFYSGRARALSQPERDESVSLVRSSFPNARMREYASYEAVLSNREYNAFFSRSRIALCPSGRVWDGWRYTIAGLAPQTAVAAPHPYNETVGPPLRDGVNAILYDVESRGSRYHLRDPDALREKLRYYLDRPSELARIADAWSADVRAGHTIMARSRYIIERLERAF